MKVAALLLLAFLCGCPALSTAPPPTHIPKGERVSNSVVRSTVALVDVNRIYCSGVVWENHIVTAAHCVRGADGFAEEDDIDIGFDRDYRPLNGAFDRVYGYTVTRYYPMEDFAVLAPLEEQPGSGRPLAPSVQRYEPVRCVGHPLGLGWTLTVGHWQGLRASPEDPTPYGYTTCNIVYGNSGGPVFNEFGEIVGITSYIHLTGAGAAWHLNGVVPLQTLRAKLLTGE